MKDYTEEKFGLLTVKRLAYTNEKGEVYYYCDCDCGEKDVIKKLTYLKRGDTKSCGCLRREKARNQAKLANENRYHHGIYSYKNTPYGAKIHNVWNNMKSRCNNKNDKHYKWYGAKGVQVCNEWLDVGAGFIDFYNWAINNGYEEGLTIDRKDVDGNYEPDNCRWITMKEQNNNMTTNVKATINGETKNITEFAEEYDINSTTIRGRLRKGKKDEELIEPVKEKEFSNIEVTQNNIIKTIKQWIEEREYLNYDLVWRRYKNGDRGERLIREKEHQNYTKLTINEIYETIENETLTLSQWADKYNIKHETIRDRYKRGWRGKDLIKQTHNKSDDNKNIKNENTYILEILN